MSIYFFQITISPDRSLDMFLTLSGQPPVSSMHASIGSQLLSNSYVPFALAQRWIIYRNWNYVFVNFSSRRNFNFRHLWLFLKAKFEEKNLGPETFIKTLLGWNIVDARPLETSDIGNVILYKILLTFREGLIKKKKLWKIP